ncbi:PQ-loop repeat-containing protein 1 [Hypsibius exemplaris]|uniref:Solute carrier family 66 member 2 n=1 Tax=Hypsibius exemplaris TaxID=2072580 RepID=A0A1W0WE39_HYPEX|nr:PQ-loop repeat-containing protein 1 [Hypsibius exemplaris]
MAHWIVGVSSLTLMFAGAVPYIPQYRTIKQTQNAEGFSTYVCLVLLVANILRIIFWFGRPFELPLLAQSFIMIGVMLGMLYSVVTVRCRNTTSVGARKRNFRDFCVTDFWQWTDFRSYVEFLMWFTGFCATLLLVFGRNTAFVETIGCLAVFTEAMLGMPQFYHNFRSQSTAGMSVAMVAMWTSGDLFETIYFIVRDVPAQFAICGLLQVSVELAILLQVILYDVSPVRVVKESCPNECRQEELQRLTVSCSDSTFFVESGILHLLNKILTV